MTEDERSRLAFLLLNGDSGSLSRRSATANAFESAVGVDPTQADFLRSEKDTRPYWETDHRATVMPLVMSGYNNSVGYGAPTLLGGNMWSVLSDILGGRQTSPEERKSAAWDGAGMAMTGALAAGAAPAGALRSGVVRNEAAPTRSIDSLGYYSKALEEAKALPIKAAPDQILATLRNKGVKPGEIEATGLAEFLQGKPSVTRDNVVGHLTDNRVRLNEVRRGDPFDNVSVEQSRGSNPVWQIIEMQPEYRGGPLRRRVVASGYASEAEARGDVPAVVRQSGVESTAKWSQHSLDPSNPTYRETVLHLPGFEAHPEWQVLSRQIEDLGAQQTALGRQSYTANAAHRAELDRMNDALIDQKRAAAEKRYELEKTLRSQQFQSGHFSEPNIIGHYQSSINQHNGRRVFTLDQLQSDWGQKLRTGGVRDNAKIAEMTTKIDELGGGLDGLTDSPAWRVADDFLSRIGEASPSSLHYSELGDALARVARGRGLIDHPQDIREQARKIASIVEREQGERKLLEAELATARAATPGHPLVNTTDQWTSTVLRRAIRNAIDENADHIAIPSGDTVLSYNPGNAHGMNAFYNDIVPKNLAKILGGLDRNGVSRTIVDQLQTPSGMKGNGFTVFDITPEMRQAAIKGMPLFANHPAASLAALLAHADRDQP